ncbi:NEDD8 ultimate buster 1-like [Mizuhopecten yessoensis]|uniref:NEDD8 ultimate buster 1 n=1 Tax=Mizuhopecten yessoensis TaxID=6573 RepID=A0A210PZW3_MIZYE|nr:NEDD8 ultimate buster 1-like [Mizuhopecten yessoensis]XP_021370904.1 NEDD8 ultimate buster 1-like [Mizuhopecten yessoensis]XP_021370905.1 NEDD8 ultimate buster 1-like [Mizuhopecten yessoensis]XP_021370906.1 NEDD8 ultimate buster 1-like [Mizuhopecten yessoensis]XP_021370907.1 NEDD8 ultimate buster 1-like [Mizuhopecten yessoensis]OWF42022.1 NEDD8 ultimate buster 1 [Mizuhopecten yessoensis]
MMEDRVVDGNYAQELHQKRVREKLNDEKIKLWLPPYTKEDGSRGDSPNDLIARYAQDLQLTEEMVSGITENLRVHALHKLAEREKYKKSGLASLKVKMTGLPTSADKVQHISLEISLNVLGKDLRDMLSERMALPADQLKLICQGRVITNQTSLESQGVKHGCQIMGLCLSMSQAETARQQEDVARMIDTRKAAELLSDNAETGDYDIQIADQSGRPLNLPTAEKKALTLAMTLHEKGRAALKKQEYGRALLLLLEADKEFRKCRADILNAVDNYAVLCLDIVWCYLCLRNVEDLHDADIRLLASEDCFQRTYGNNMERLLAVKGGSGTELALFMRLHLLQGIVAFHQHRTEEAGRLLNKAEEELQRLNVDEDKLAQVIHMGFQERDGRLALRLTNGDVEASIQYIMKKREEKKEITKKVEEEKRKKKLQKCLGSTAKGDKVNVDTYEMLLAMGFRNGASAEALRQSNNDLSLALEVLQNHPELLDLPDPVTMDSSVSITDDMLAQVISMGYESDMARNALQKHHGNIESAIEDLIKSGGVVLSPNGESSSSGPSTSSSHSSSSADKQKQKEVLDDLVSDIAKDEDDYLDLTLQEETQFLNHYKSLLESIKK